MNQPDLSRYMKSQQVAEEVAFLRRLLAAVLVAQGRRQFWVRHGEMDKARNTDIRISFSPNGYIMEI